MHYRLLLPIALSSFLLSACGGGDSTESGEAAPTERETLAAKTFARHCSSCHTTPYLAPLMDMIEGKSSQFVVDWLTHGGMRWIGNELSDEEKRLAAAFMTRDWSTDGLPLPIEALVVACDANSEWFDYSQPPATGLWGFDERNTRALSAEQAGLTAAKLADLSLQWSAAFPDATRNRTQPLVAGGAVFAGSHNGTVYALDRETGCLRWSERTITETRSSPVMARWENGADSGATVYVGDGQAWVYALDAENGHLRWKTHLDSNPYNRLSASFAIHEDKLIVPISGGDGFHMNDQDYECCTHSGAVAALDRHTGEVLWQLETIGVEATVQATRPWGGKVRGPSGASVWNTPTIDDKRGLAYFGTGNNLTPPATPTSDAIFAVDLDTGEVRWIYQGTVGDVWSGACAAGDTSVCPDLDAPDADFGAPPILATVKGKDYLLAGQKSGVVHALDPDDDGALLWKRRLGRGGGDAGGIHFGMAVAEGVVYVPMNDPYDFEYQGRPPNPGLTALDIESGEVLWAMGRAEICGEDADCLASMSSPVTVIPGAVVGGFYDGMLRAFDTDTGEILWAFDAADTFELATGRTTKGGGFSGPPGPVFAGGQLFIVSGYNLVLQPGNAFLALGLSDGPDNQQEGENHVRK